MTNQCPHNLDLYQWLFGLPSRVNGFAHIGKYHDIEVEDEVTAYFEHENGMVGHFIVTTAETPGSNRMEIVGEYGKLVLRIIKLFCIEPVSRCFVLSKNRKAGWAMWKIGTRKFL